ncbi:MAG: hypothetical protein GY851_05330 [bacterium]|nr:hypothetical protein [bacterium]
MKKLAIIAGMAVCIAGLAFAGTLPIPFFLDNGGLAGGGGVPSSGTAAYVRVLNMSASPVVCTLSYKDTAGTAAGGPATFTLNAGQVKAWRPAADDPVEGDGQAIINSSSVVGSATVTYVGDGALAGSVTTILSDGNMSAFAINE